MTTAGTGATTATGTTPGDRSPVLAIRDLVTEFGTGDEAVRAVDGFSLDVHPGEVVGLVGESGSGKSVSMLSVLGLLPRPGRVVSGEVEFDGQDLLAADDDRLRSLRGRDISMIFQDPMTSMNPVFTVGFQVAEAILAHDPGVGQRAAMARAVELLDAVGVPEPAERVKQYPHEYSGGMRQRAMIAMAMANKPRLLIADEPTTALDVTIQAQVLDVLARARANTTAAMVLITHDLGVVAEVADRVVVMYAGRVVESAGVHDTFHAPRHPYTVGLMGSLPTLEGDRSPLRAIPGNPPPPGSLPSGCAFHPRCELRNGRDRCVDERPRLRRVGPDHASACHFHDELQPAAAGHDPSSARGSSGEWA